MLVYMLLWLLIVEGFAFTFLLGACRAASRADHYMRQEAQQRHTRFHI